MLQMTGDQGAVFCAQRNMNAFVPPPAAAQDYVQGAVLQMTGDQGAVLLCGEEHERFCPPPPPQPNPKLLSRRDDLSPWIPPLFPASMTLLSPPPPPQPNPKWLVPSINVRG